MVPFSVITYDCISVTYQKITKSSSKCYKYTVKYANYVGPIDKLGNVTLRFATSWEHPWTTVPAVASFAALPRSGQHRDWLNRLQCHI